ncbi:hypothetical protein DFS34DRAFT_649140 [Phlyctochytrium arcticum]|nr:hypothetical protein DFS34DRAFT_649140 [Phlyctochytrium arcticum]
MAAEVSEFISLYVRNSKMFPLPFHATINNLGLLQICTVIYQCIREQRWVPKPDPPQNPWIKQFKIHLVLYNIFYIAEIIFTDMLNQFPCMVAHHIVAILLFCRYIVEFQAVCVLTISPYLFHAAYWTIGMGAVSPLLMMYNVMVMVVVWAGFYHKFGSRIAKKLLVQQRQREGIDKDHSKGQIGAPSSHTGPNLEDIADAYDWPVSYILLYLPLSELAVNMVTFCWSYGGQRLCPGGIDQHTWWDLMRVIARVGIYATGFLLLIWASAQVGVRIKSGIWSKAPRKHDRDERLEAHARTQEAYNKALRQRAQSAIAGLTRD